MTRKRDKPVGGGQECTGIFRKAYFFTVLSSIFFFLFSPVNAAGQAPAKEYWWVYLAGRPYAFLQESAPALSEDARQKRLRRGIPIFPGDYPVYPGYVALFRQRFPELRIVGKSRWLHALVVEAPPEARGRLRAVAAMPWVTGVAPVRKLRVVQPEGIATFTSADLRSGLDLVTDSQLQMLGIDWLHQQGFYGQNVTIAFLDAGFPGVDTVPAFAHVFAEGRLKATYNVPSGHDTVWRDHYHGTVVFSVVAGWIPGVFEGGAPEANFLLFRTEVVDSERRVEEFYWLIGAEWADSLGADIINSSLGYWDFDGTAEDYPWSAMDGNTTVVTRAADLAAKRGILVVNSAGNTGHMAWHRIIAPADGDSVLAVGAITFGGELAFFSARGPSADGRIKPDVVAPGVRVAAIFPRGRLGYASGTSLSAPLVTSLAACLLSAFPGVSPLTVGEALRQTASRAGSPDNDWGWGLPNGKRAFRWLGTEKIQTKVWVEPVVLYRTGQTVWVYVRSWQSGEYLIQGYTLGGQRVVAHRVALRAGGTYRIPVVVPWSSGLAVWQVVSPTGYIYSAKQQFVVVDKQ